MPSVLVLFAHPGHRHSVANRQMAALAEGLEDVTFVDLYARYPRHKIDIDVEQQQLLDHDIIVFQFPLMWYSTPSLLKEWQDLVLEYGFAYGEGGTALKGKSVLCAITVGGPKDAYNPEGSNRFFLRQMLSPLEQTANLCGMEYLPPYCLFASLKARSDERLETHVETYGNLLKGLADGKLGQTSLAGHELLAANDITAILEGAT